ncbi:hypothetical protein ACWD4G_41845 [Streptomyces sp. NPDC002643]
MPQPGNCTPEAFGDELDLLLEPGKRWWGGAAADGRHMPFGARPHARDLVRSAGLRDDEMRGGNQSCPLLVSSRGRVVWSERPFAFSFGEGTTPRVRQRRRRRTWGHRPA